jgi:glutathione synthase/RimK-type ligase-like ATP-grasp enzyme
MNPRPPTRAEREAALARLDARLEDDPLSIELALERARLLDDLDRAAEARDLYLRVVARSPNDARALNDFGTFLMRGGFRAAARTVYERALAIEPRSALAHANLATVFFAGNDYEAARIHYEAALAIDPQSAPAHQGLSYALTRLGRDEEALAHRHLGFAGRSLTTGPYRGAGPPVDVLLIVAAGGGTLYADTFLDDRLFRTTTLVADLHDGTPLPPADVVFNAIGDADRAGAELRAVERLLAGTNARVINPPERVLATAREANAARLGTLDGVVAPRISAVPRDAIIADGPRAVERAGFTFPLLVRAPGFHSGLHFALVEQAGALASAVAGFPAGDVLLVEYVDVRDDDGAVRKYRMMVVDGTLYPMHVAVSADWKVHYFSAGMAADASKRAEDERFLADPAAAIGTPALAALARIHATVRLDYMGIDFALDRRGRVVAFEANATMIVLPPPDEAIWEYRREPVARIVEAVRKMLRRRQ